MTTLQSLQFLIKARQAEMDDEALTVYLTALEGESEALLERACLHFARTPRALYESALPTVGDLLAKCAQFARADELAERLAIETSLPVAREDDPRTWVRCQACNDNGYTIHECSGGSARTCGRPAKGHFVTDERTKRSYYQAACQQGHDYAVPCHCHGNPNAVQSAPVRPSATSSQPWTAKRFAERVEFYAAERRRARGQTSDAPTASGWTRARARDIAASVPFDAKAAAAGDREP